MYEYDDITNESQKIYEQRLSSYITFTFHFFKSIDISSTTFYQPNLGYINDYRIANDTGLEIFINKHLNYKTSFNLLYDTKQPIGVPELVYALKNGLTLKF
jgi:putative salt-induced outer membrane protein YdiY